MMACVGVLLATYRRWLVPRRNLLAESMHSSVQHNISVGNFIELGVRKQGVEIVTAAPEPGRTQSVRCCSDALVFRENVAAFQPRMAIRLLR